MGEEIPAEVVADVMVAAAEAVVATAMTIWTIISTVRLQEAAV